jgi:hypothetical protein
VDHRNQETALNGSRAAETMSPFASAVIAALPPT